MWLEVAFCLFAVGAVRQFYRCTKANTLVGICTRLSSANVVDVARTDEKTGLVDEGAAQQPLLNEFLAEPVLQHFMYS